MASASPKIYEDEFYRWFATWLRDKGLQFSKCGFKTGRGLGVRHEIDLTTGFWKEPSYSASKPPRWLYQIEPKTSGVRAIRPAWSSNLGAINASQEDKAGVIFRLVPLVRQGASDFLHSDDFEIHVLFAFHGATPRGSSSESFSLDPDSGQLRFKGEKLPYIAAGLLGIRPRDAELQVTSGGQQRVITYGEVIDALSADITSAPVGGPAVKMQVFDLSQMAEFDRLKNTIADAWAAAGPVRATAVAATGTGVFSEEEEEYIVAPESLSIPENTDLHGIDSAVYRQINAALKSGKQHIMLYGPPGTGKTTLARWIATTLTGGKWTLITGSSDWSSQDIIGGYQPLGEGSVGFIPGVLLRNFDRPLIIDELNRCDIDKVIGPLFTVLSGQQTTLPYRMNIEEPDSLQYVILPESKPSAADHEFAPGPSWRIIATINSIDKAALYQMSYALSRRFGWVYVDVPLDTARFIADYLRRQDSEWVEPQGAACPLAVFWSEVNTVRALGPAPIIDTIKVVRMVEDQVDFFAVPSPGMREALLDAIDMVLLPMLDGIALQDAEVLANSAVSAFRLDEPQQQRITKRLVSVAV